MPSSPPKRTLGKIPSRTRHMAPLHRPSFRPVLPPNSTPFWHLYVSSFLPHSHSPSILCHAITSCVLHSQTSWTNPRCQIKPYRRDRALTLTLVANYPLLGRPFLAEDELRYLAACSWK